MGIKTILLFVPLMMASWTVMAEGTDDPSHDAIPSAASMASLFSGSTHNFYLPLPRQPALTSIARVEFDPSTRHLKISGTTTGGEPVSVAVQELQIEGDSDEVFVEIITVEGERVRGGPYHWKEYRL